MDEIKRIQLIGGLAVILGRDMTKEAIKIYCGCLRDIPFGQLERACDLWMKKPNSPQFPTPGQLLACLTPTDDELAREATSRVIEALHKFGDPYGHTEEREWKAKEYIGSLGWELVKRKGGWCKLSNIGNDDLSSTAQAQMRELCISIVRHHRLGLQDSPPQLPNYVVESPRLESKSIPLPEPSYSTSPLKLNELLKKANVYSEVSGLDLKKRQEELRRQAQDLFTEKGKKI